MISLPMPHDSSFLSLSGALLDTSKPLPRPREKAGFSEYRRAHDCESSHAGLGNERLRIEEARGEERKSHDASTLTGRRLRNLVTIHS
jgi:hypothetical protein